MPGPDVLRVSVVGGHERVDLVVPAALAVAELLPDLARRLLPGDALAPGALRLAPVGGTPLATSSGLAAQGVRDGELLTLTSEADHVPPLVDDLALVVGAVAESLPRAAADAVLRATAALASLLLAAGGSAVLLDDSLVFLGAGVALVLVGLAALAVRRDARLVGTAAGWLAVGYGGAVGAAAGLAGAGAGVVVTGAAALVATRSDALGAAPVAGVVLLLTGGVPLLSPVPVALVATVALAAVALVGDLVPWLAATLGGLSAPMLGDRQPRAPDPVRVDAAVRRAHTVLLVCSVATGLVLVTLGPLVVRTGPGGLVVVGLCCAVVALRARRHRAGVSGPPALVGSVLALLTSAAAAWETWPDHHLALAAACASLECWPSASRCFRRGRASAPDGWPRWPRRSPWSDCRRPCWPRPARSAWSASSCRDQPARPAGGAGLPSTPPAHRAGGRRSARGGPRADDPGPLAPRRGRRGGARGARRGSPGLPRGGRAGVIVPLPDARPSRARRPRGSPWRHVHLDP